MGKISKGILGGFAGKVGTVIGSRWKGIDYIKSIPATRPANNSLPQLEQQAKFKMVTRFPKSMKDLVTMGFKSQAIQQTEMNSALGYTLKNAVSGNYPNSIINYNMVLISQGSLPNAVNPSAALGDPGNILFSWENNSGMGKAKAGDKAILVAHCAGLNQTVYSKGILRSAQTGVLNVAAFNGQDVQTWISFVTEDEKDIATSIYTGEVTV